MFASSTKFSNRSNVKFEVLEVRRLLATVIVNTLADETLVNATTSLREAIVATAETVAFAPALAGSIVLNSELVIGNDLTIAGPGANKIEISGDGASRVFRTTAGVNASISGVTISGGRAEKGGGIYHGGAKLTLSSVKLVSNNARGKDGEYNDGQDAHGGAIYNEGELVLIDSNVLANGAIGGNGQLGLTAGNAGSAWGGAIYNDADAVLEVRRTSFLNNGAVGGTPNGGNGNVGGGRGGAAFGGAIVNLGTAQLRDCTFAVSLAGGTAGGDGELASDRGGDALGGAIYSAGTIDIQSCVFSKNGATGGGGGATMGGMFYSSGGEAKGGALFNTGNLTINTSTFNANYAVAGNKMIAVGGAIASYGSVSVDKTTIAGNTAKSDVHPDDNRGDSGGGAYAGGIYVGGEGGDIAASTIVDNNTVGGAGGSGYHLHGSETLSAPGGEAQGGGVFAGSVLTMVNSTIANNKVTGGTGGTFDMTTQSPGGRGGDAIGGGIATWAPADVTLVHVTIAGNAAFPGSGGAGGEGALGPIAGGADGSATGGGVFTEGVLNLSNTLIAMNVAPTAPDVSAAVASNGFNLVGKSDGSDGWLASDKKGTIAAPLDPKLTALASHGGPTKTMEPAADSPALDAGKSLGVLSDQRGIVRPIDLPSMTNASGGDGADIGAYERQSVPAVQTPSKSFVFGTTPVTIQNEDFDVGGEGVAYDDVDDANRGGAYRVTCVDIQPTSDTGGGFNIGWAKGGEWMEYTVDVKVAGKYSIDFRLASPGSGGKFHLEVDGKDVTGPISVPNTGGSQTWKTITKSGIALTAGKHVICLKMDAAGSTGSVGNFNWMKFVASPTTVNAAAAAHVRDGSYANVNYGANPTLEVKKRNAGYNRESYLKFDLSTFATVGNAKLRLYGGLADALVASIQMSVSSASTNWAEMSITWKNKPAASAPAATATISGTARKWYEIDVSSLVKSAKAAGQTAVTLVLRSNTYTNTLCTFSSDEAANGPRLVVTA